MEIGLHPKPNHPEDWLINSALVQEERTSSSAFMSKPIGLPESVADYRVIGRLGAGGMGVVLEAEQRELKRHVAIKLLRSDNLPTDYHVHAFHREVEALGRLRHPGIAAIYGAGQSDDGRPFFAMELIRGSPIDQYIRRNEIPLRDRLELFCRICDAVSHAHRRGVVHRDLKPSNILVEPGGMPKILDFGLAKALQSDPDLATYATEPGRLAGTLPYMSPEQVRGQTDDIDTRTDVYALGVVLFELLSGQLPYTASWSNLSGAVEAICEQPPARLPLNHHPWSSDLGLVVETSLAKDPAARYQSVERLSDDVHRVLSQKPILARPPAVSYRLGKFVLRNKVACALGALAALAVVSGVAAGITLYFRAERERSRAMAEAARAEAINEFLIEDMLQSASAAYMPDEDITVRRVFDLASKRVETAFPEHPRLEASIRTVLANVYFTLNDFDEAERHLRRAEDLLAREVGPLHVETLKLLADLARARHGRGQYADAERIARSALVIQERELGRSDPATIGTLHVLGNALARLWRHDEAEKVLVEAYGSAQRVLGPRHHDTLEIKNDLAVLYWYRHRLDEAIEQFRSLAFLRASVDGSEHPATLAVMSNLGLALWSKGDLSEAESVLAPTLVSREKILPSGHPDILATANNLGLVKFQVGSFEQAEGLFRQVYEKREQRLGPSHRETVNALQNVALTIILMGDVDRARPYQVELIERRRAAAQSVDASQADLIDYAVALLVSEPGDLRDPGVGRDVMNEVVSQMQEIDPYTLRVHALACYMNGQFPESHESAKRALAAADASDIFGRAEASILTTAARTSLEGMDEMEAARNVVNALPEPKNAAVAPVIRPLCALALRSFMDNRFALSQAAVRDIGRVVAAPGIPETLGAIRCLLSYTAFLVMVGDSNRAETYLDSIEAALEPLPARSNWLRAYARALRGSIGAQRGDPGSAQFLAEGIDGMDRADETPAREYLRALELAVAALDDEANGSLWSRLTAELDQLKEVQSQAGPGRNRPQGP